MRTVRISDEKLKLRIKIKNGIPFLNRHQTHERIECPLWHHKVSGPTNACLVIHFVTSVTVHLCPCVLCLWQSCVSVWAWPWPQRPNLSHLFPGVTHLPAINSSTSTAFKLFSSLHSLSDPCATNLCGFYPVFLQSFWERKKKIDRLYFFLIPPPGCPPSVMNFAKYGPFEENLLLPFPPISLFQLELFSTLCYRLFSLGFFSPVFPI